MSTEICLDVDKIVNPVSNIDNIGPSSPEWDLGFPDISTSDGSEFDTFCAEFKIEDDEMRELEESFCENAKRNLCELQKSTVTKAAGFSSTDADVKERDDCSFLTNLRFAEDQLLHCLSIENTFQCQKCGKSFKHQKSLKRHNKNFRSCSKTCENVDCDKIDDYVKTVKEEYR